MSERVSFKVDRTNRSETRDRADAVAPVEPDDGIIIDEILARPPREG